MSDSLDGYPPAVREALSRLLADLTELAPAPAALVVYGSLAKGTFREGESDVNLAVVLHEATPATLRALSAPLRAARRAVKASPMVLAKDEIARLADVFPIKVADMKAAHHVLVGEDPFVDVEIESEHLRLRVEQELRNHLLRLRRQAIFAGDDPRELSRAIYASVSSLGIELGALLEVAGAERPSEPGLLATMRAAAVRFDLDGVTLDALCDVKEGAPLEDPRALFDGLLAVIGRAVAAADTMDVAS